MDKTTKPKTTKQLTADVEAIKLEIEAMKKDIYKLKLIANIANSNIA